MDKFTELMKPVWELDKENSTANDHSTRHIKHYQVQFRFNNGYGASIIAGTHFYTSEGKPYECAVMKFHPEDYEDDLPKLNITYETPITDDVIGHMTLEEVKLFLSDVKRLLPDTFPEYQIINSIVYKIIGFLRGKKHYHNY